MLELWQQGKTLEWWEQRDQWHRAQSEHNTELLQILKRLALHQHERRRWNPSIDSFFAPCVQVDLGLRKEAKRASKIKVLAK